VIKGRDSKVKAEDNRLVLIRAFYQGVIYFFNEFFLGAECITELVGEKASRSEGQAA